MVRKKRDMCVDTYQSRNTSCAEDVVLHVALGWSIDIGLLNTQKKRKLIKNYILFSLPCKLNTKYGNVKLDISNLGNDNDYLVIVSKR